MFQGTTRALLSAHVKECGKRYTGLQEEQRRNHSQNQSLMVDINSRIDRLTTALTNTREYNIKADADERITVINSELKLAHRILVLAGTIILMLLSASIYLLRSELKL